MTEPWTPGFACPRCASPMHATAHASLVCPTCDTAAARDRGIYRFLLPARAVEIAPFLTWYRRIRDAEGYRRRDGDYYRALPNVVASDPQAAVWRVRRESFRHFREQVLPREHLRSLRIVDLGAGNGWLCHRLAALGHRCVAVDWLDDAADGLGAFIHYPVTYVRVQADFDDPPFAPGQFDLVVFNASLHYARDPAATLLRARKLLVERGALVVMDSPVFSSAEAGQRMLAAQEAAFAVRYGQGPAQPGVGYITAKALTENAGAELRSLPSRGDLGWRLRRRLAGFKARREPARFGIWFSVG